MPVGLSAFLLEQGRRIDWQPVTVLILLYSGLLATAFPNWASQSITRSLGSVAETTGFLATPVVGLVGASLVLQEPLGLMDTIGFGLVPGGVAAASLTAPAARSAEDLPAEPGMGDEAPSDDDPAPAAKPTR